MAESNVSKEKYFTISPAAEIPGGDSKIIRNLLDGVEQRTTNWLKTDKWKHHKTVKNRTELKDDENAYNNIDVYEMTDKNHPKISIYKVEAFVPEPNSNEILNYYNTPTLRTQFDNDMMSTFYDIPIKLNLENAEDDDNKNEQKDDKSNDSVDDCYKISMNVCQTLPVAAGWVTLISSRIFMQVVENKYCKQTNENCAISTFIPTEMINKKQFKDILRIKDEDLKTNVIGKNISLYLGVKRVENTKYTKVTYILQANNGGLIPQSLVEMGMVDQHMIVIFRKMTTWLLNDKK